MYQDICLLTSRDIGYFSFYFQEYGTLCNIFFTFRDIVHLEKLIMGIFATLKTCLFSSIGTPYTSLIITDGLLFDTILYLLYQHAWDNQSEYKVKRLAHWVISHVFDVS